MRKCKACGRDFASTDQTEEICYACIGALKRLNGYAVPVVRCKDCKCCEMCYPEKQIDKEATQAWICKRYKMYRKPDDFCSYGERREGE